MCADLAPSDSVAVTGTGLGAATAPAGRDPALAGPWYEAASKPILWLGIALLAMPWLVYRLLVSAGRERLAWAFIALRPSGE